jgi:predicted ribosome quality control (RQC) complex YloA/Tae2 family protein
MLIPTRVREHVVVEKGNEMRSEKRRQLPVLLVTLTTVLLCVGCSPDRSGDYYDDYLYERGQQPDNEDMTHEERVNEQKEIIRRQEDEIKRQDRELEDLRRQQFHNQSLKRYSVR